MISVNFGRPSNIYTLPDNVGNMSNNNSTTEATRTSQFGEIKVGDTVAFRATGYRYPSSQKVHTRKICEINDFGVWIKFDGLLEHLWDVTDDYNIIEICRPHPKDGILTHISDLELGAYICGYVKEGE